MLNRVAAITLLLCSFAIAGRVGLAIWDAKVVQDGINRRATQCLELGLSLPGCVTSGPVD